jgi:hypothetical protein
VNAQASPSRSPVTRGIYHVPVEYQMVLETALRTMRVRSKDLDPLRKTRILRVARKLVTLTARAIRGEVRGWLQVYPQYEGSPWGSAAHANAAAATALIDAIMRRADDLTVVQHLEALLESLNGHTPTL